MKTVVEWLNKRLAEQNMVPGYITGYTNASGEKRTFTSPTGSKERIW